MKYELIFCDFDGTLLRNDFTVGEKSVKAIKDYISVSYTHLTLPTIRIV